MIKVIAQWLLPALYLAAVVAAASFAVAHSSKDAFCGLFLVVLGLPWTFLILPIVFFLPGLFEHSIIPGLILAAGACCLNLLILCRLLGCSWRSAHRLAP